MVLEEEPDSFRYVGSVAANVRVPEHWYTVAADAECVLYVPQFIESDGRTSPAIGAAWGISIRPRKAA